MYSSVFGDSLRPPIHSVSVSVSVVLHSIFSEDVHNGFSPCVTPERADRCRAVRQSDSLFIDPFASDGEAFHNGYGANTVQIPHLDSQ